MAAASMLSALTTENPVNAGQVVTGHPVQPSAGIVGKALGRPGRQRGQERALDRILHQGDMPHAGLARQQRHQPAIFAPEEMLDQGETYTNPLRACP